jgi:D-sedoheptulose 7-phosphate isomerase
MNIMNIDHYIKGYFAQATQTLSKLDKRTVSEFIEALIVAYNEDHAIYIFGNGGSGANASHICGDFVKGVSYALEKRFRFFCLNDNVPAIMAIANDISFDDVFVEQLKNVLKRGDLVIGISGSGNSKNVVEALKYAKRKGAKTVGFCGYDGGKVKELVHLAVHVPIADMELSEDIHLIIAHCCKQIIMQSLNCGNDKGARYSKRIKS